MRAAPIALLAGILAAATAALALAPDPSPRAPEAAAGAPGRVVSMNLCTDQIAMMIAAPGQLVSVSRWSAREAASNMAEAARAYPLNDGHAERIYLMRPDLVLAGPYTNRAAVAMLERLGVKVEIVPAAQSIAEIRAIVAQIGRALGREAEAAAVAADLDARLAALAARAARLPRIGAAFHYPNNYTSGSDTLADAVLDLAGLENAAAEAGLTGSAKIDLETLVMLDPFLVRSKTITGTETGRSYEPQRHPALRALMARGGATVEERWQVCGTPFVARAVETLIAARE